MTRKFATVLILLLLVTSASDTSAIQRFPKPEFETGYLQPETMQPSARAELLAVLDVFMLIAALSITSWLVIRKRSRNGVFIVSLFSLLYFGFYRQGCVCSIGAIQNVALALADPSYFIPLSAIAFFILPLVYTLLFGRTFCAGVCPFGALQDLVTFRPMNLGVRLNAILGMIPYLYLGLAVLYAVTRADFIICRYDPFVGIFRFNASFGMILFTVALLLVGVFIARPYCRFLCPYGVLLNWISRFSFRHITITPAECIQCRLCENACPYDAIDLPTTAKNPVSHQTRLRRLMLLTLLIPLLMIAGGWTGAKLHETLSLVHPKVRLAAKLMDHESVNKKPEPLEITAFHSSGKSTATIYAEAAILVDRFYIGGWILGGFIGLVFGLVIAGKMVTRYRVDYIPNKGSCFSCVRCVDYCPIKR